MFIRNQTTTYLCNFSRCLQGRMHKNQSDGFQRCLELPIEKIEQDTHISVHEDAINIHETVIGL